MLNTMGTSEITLDRLMLETLLNNLQSSLTQDHPIFGFLPKNVDSLLPVIFTNTLIHPRAHLMLLMDLISTSPMDQELSQDSLDRILLGLLDLKPKTLSLLRSLLFMESVSLPLNSMESWEWLGLLFQLTVFL